MTNNKKLAAARVWGIFLKLIILLFLIGFAVWAKRAGIFEKLLQGINHLGFWAAPAFLGAFVLSCLFLFPTAIMTIGAGVLFPLPLAIFLSVVIAMCRAF